MKTNLTWGETLSITSMLFGLFFGAGNLIFPAFMGQEAGSNVWYALAGFLITGVGMPMLAVTALGITGSSGLLNLSQRIGRRFGLIFTCALYLTIGPFFASPRCVTVPFEIGAKALLPAGFNEQLALFLFSLAFMAAALWFSLRPGKILVWTGKILTPLFLVVLGILLVAALTQPTSPITAFTPTPAYTTAPVLQGLLDGYNTMDTLAGLAFGIIVVDVIRKLGIKDSGAIAKNTVKAGVFSCLLMGIIYILVSLAGAESRGYAPINGNGGAVLASISSYYFSDAGAALLALIVLFACLKTVIGLITSCSEALVAMFPGKFTYEQLSIAFAIITFLIANVGLSAIIQFSIPVFMMLYPIAIMLTLTSLAGHICGLDRLVIRSIMTMVVFSSVFDFIKALPPAWLTAFGLNEFVTALTAVLPFFAQGFGWILPALLGLVIGIILKILRTKTNCSQ
ncbi:MAG: branched-chain amino acid transport system II carrier protein [Selenomonas sp.]|uniref:branched-chain amino acid transport system II carrier protein n=1 Tax=Selenomonas sp. TaxID=2053611 RepID=UPI0025DF4D1D|nr:branched-chain amino acid transport system II carrier protein [Selenomonas sp.]MCR5439036.1 branched-chain amino acid transport system II carrier protein [Selenomonas sp.]